MAPLIEIIGLSKRYYRKKQTDVHALRHLNLTVEKGDIFGIIGQSGAGKSTLIRCLARLEKPSFGEILIHGQNICLLEGNELRKYYKSIGMIFQHFNLLSSRTAAENIAYPLEISGVDFDQRRKRVQELIALVGLEEQKEQYPAQLSGGQKQRVGIARALAADPEILFCDEATSSLDPKTTKEILTLLKKVQLKLGLTIVLITHQMEVIKQICNKVAVLERGEVKEAGTLAQIFVHPTHSTTKSFVQNTLHEIPSHFFKDIAPNKRLLHLHFKGEKADLPIISQLVRKFNVDANILLGWIDSLQTVTVGNLIIQLSGEPAHIEQALAYIKKLEIEYEVFEPIQVK
ncbi:MAG TPA: ATP-binding cassette domain-containing protein [Rhabdochlamydiaceae bacterium]|nr:ATP-binding cassette domain-containing protein [Rhabdochlamydiaceae bacterium]